MTSFPDIQLDRDTPANGETTQDWVYQSLRFAVLSGQIQPGVALTIRGIANRLDVSAMPVREALRRLVSEGALGMKSNRRIEVPTMTPAKLSELLELRILLESHAAERALPYVTPEKLDILSTLNTAQNAGFLEKDPVKIVIGNLDFHRTLYACHPAPAVIPLIESIWLQLGPLHRLSLATIEDNYQVDRHLNIMDAIRTNNAFGLKIAIEADIREGAGYATQTTLLEQHARSGTDLQFPSDGYLNIK